MRTRAMLGVLSLVAAMFGVTSAAQTTQPAGTQPGQDDGSTLYATYCAACHGRTAQGDGPLADSMRRRPANLTEIAKRNNGVFPKEMVFRIIDGRQPVRGHGGPDMPVWGDAFTRSVEVSSDEGVKNRIDAIVNYLETIQVRRGE
jgi:mono/diheme cytochrome c family protein